MVVGKLASYLKKISNRIKDYMISKDTIKVLKENIGREDLVSIS